MTIFNGLRPNPPGRQFSLREKNHPEAFKILSYQRSRKKAFTKASFLKKTLKEREVKGSGFMDGPS